METKTKLIVLMLAVVFFSFTTVNQKKEPGKTGKELFESNCVKCHGTDGTKGKWGAKNLQASTLSDGELLTIISNGKRMMPAWNHTLTQNEVELIKDYIKTLRK